MEEFKIEIFFNWAEEWEKYDKYTQTKKSELFFKAANKKSQ